MRRALGLRETSSSAPQSAPSSAPVGTARPHRHRFVRDGEVPVTVVHHHDHDDGSSINKIAAARQALHDQVAARERAEHLLQEARATIQTLETKLAHERIGKDEALRRSEGELAAERTARQQAEQDRDEAVAARQDAERMREVMLRAGLKTKAGSRTAGRLGERTQTGADEASQTQSDAPPATTPGDVAPASTQPRRRGRPPKASQPEGGFVEWWKPNWRERFR